MSAALTIPDYLGKRYPNGDVLRVLSSAVIIVFFTIYTASGMVAGGKLFDSALGQSYYTGLCITAGVTIAYTVFGGFWAVSLTDLFQGTIMAIALVIVPVVAFRMAGGWNVSMDLILTVNPTGLDWFAGVTLVGMISALAWGLGYFGQPHIIVRFMAIRSVEDVPTARNIGMGWMLVVLVVALMTGFAGLAYMTASVQELADPETIFIVLTKVLFNGPRTFFHRLEKIRPDHISASAFCLANAVELSAASRWRRRVPSSCDSKSPSNLRLSRSASAERLPSFISTARWKAVAARSCRDRPAPTSGHSR